MNDEPTSLYIHIPFCKSRCFYCDFNTFVAPSETMAVYVAQLKQELSMIARYTTRPLKTVFFGGGTPTALSSDALRDVLHHLWSEFNADSDAEVTVEANPGSVTVDKLRALYDGGVNRLSFGGQTFNPRLLMTIGRIHEVADIRASIECAASVGFKRINLDLMFGLPEQTQEDVTSSLAAALELPIDHISAYWLKVEDGTPFGEWQQAGRLPLPGEDAEADMYDLVVRTLLAHGYEHYEISNFSKPMAQARHNLVYWRNQPYLAAGAGAHGYFGTTRYENHRRLDDYGRSILNGERPVATTEDVTARAAMENAIMLGLRLAEGVSKQAFASSFGVSVDDVFGETISRLAKLGQLEVTENRILLPHSLWPVGNVIFEQFLD